MAERKMTEPSQSTNGQKPQDDDKSTKDLILEAQKHFDKGRSLNQKKYEESILEYRTALRLQETVHGRYHHDIAILFFWIGWAYHFKTEPDSEVALMAYATCLRIGRFLSGDVNNPNINVTFIAGILQEKGFTDGQIEQYDNDMKTSILYEKDGDAKREAGDYSSAMVDYEKAISVEESSFGNKNNPTLVYLWRKIACISSVKRDNRTAIDWSKGDLMHAGANKWLDKSDHILSARVSQCVRNGDVHYVTGNYKQAIAEYSSAKTIASSLVLEEERVEVLARVRDMGGLLENQTSSLVCLKENVQTVAVEKTKSEESLRELMARVEKMGAMIEAHASTLHTLLQTTEAASAERSKTEGNQMSLIDRVGEMSKVLEYQANTLQGLSKSTETAALERTKTDAIQLDLLALVQNLSTTLEDIQKSSYPDEASQRELAEKVESISGMLDAHTAMLKSLSDTVKEVHSRHEHEVQHLRQHRSLLAENAGSNSLIDNSRSEEILLDLVALVLKESDLLETQVKGGSAASPHGSFQFGINMLVIFLLYMNGAYWKYNRSRDIGLEDPDEFEYDELNENALEDQWKFWQSSIFSFATSTASALTSESPLYQSFIGSFVGIAAAVFLFVRIFVRRTPRTDSEATQDPEYNAAVQKMMAELSKDKNRAHEQERQEQEKEQLQKQMQNDIGEILDDISAFYRLGRSGWTAAFRGVKRVWSAVKENVIEPDEDPIADYVMASSEYRKKPRPSARQ